MNEATSAFSLSGPETGRTVRLVEYGLLFGCVVLIPFDIPAVHQACLPLAALAVILAVLRRDMRPFLQFLNQQPLIVGLVSLFWIISLFSIFGNLPTIMNSLFQQQAGWVRALSQAALLMVTSVFPLYFGFCLWRVGNWVPLITKAAWWSLPIPYLVGFMQIANLLHVPGLAHLPYVGAAYEEGSFWRLTSVARESSWFGSFACVVLPFLVMDIPRLSGWKKLAGIVAIGNLLLFVILGTSKSAYAALALEGAVGGLIYFITWRPWRVLGKAVFGLGVILVVLFAMAVAAPAVYAHVVGPFASKAEAVYKIFEPLVLGNTKFISIGTRFGMASAGIAMGEAHPLFGVGLGQFGFHAYNYTPLWGLNAETLGWLSNDKNAWPSTSNLYARLIGETGPMACAVYCALRLVLLLLVGIRLLRKDRPSWGRDLGVLSAMVALIAFDFHRDSFINLDAWVLLGMAIACSQSERVAEPRRPALMSAAVLKRIFLVAGVASFAIVLSIVLAAPVTYLASATLAPKDKGIKIGPAGGGNEAALDVAPTLSGTYRFQEFRMYWASTTVAVRIISDHPDLVRAVLGDHLVQPQTLASYIEDSITVLLADKQTTLTLQYRNPDPVLAKSFLTVAIDETDRLVLEAAKRPGRQAGQLLQVVLASNLDYAARQSLLIQTAAQELQSDFNAAGDNASFDYIEHPGVLPDLLSPDPPTVLFFGFGLALLAGAGAAALSRLWLGYRVQPALRVDLSVQ